METKKVTLLINFPLKPDGSETKPPVETQHDNLFQALAKVANTNGWSSYVLTEVADAS